MAYLTPFPGHIVRFEIDPTKLRMSIMRMVHSLTIFADYRYVSVTTHVRSAGPFIENISISIVVAFDENFPDVLDAKIEQSPDLTRAVGGTCLALLICVTKLSYHHNVVKGVLRPV